MKDGTLVAGLDLGSTKTCAVIGQVMGDDRDVRVKILGVGMARHTGVRAGLVRDIEETTQSIVDAMHDAQRMAGVQVPPIHCGIAGDHVQLRTSPGLASVTGEEISAADVDRVNGVARAISLGPDRELLHSIPQSYKVDEQDGIHDPVGMTGMRLEVDMYLVSVQAAAAQNVRKSVERAGFRVAKLVFEPLASSLSVLTAEERELGCALVDIGGSSTRLAIVREGRIRHIASIPHAGDRVTADIVHGLSITQGDAEQLKSRWGVAYTPLVDPEEDIALPSTPAQGERQVKRELLSHIIQERLHEVLGLVAAEVEGSEFGAHLPAGVITIGGVANMPGVVELARETFALPARVGAPGDGLMGLVDSVNTPRFAVGAGLAIYGAMAGRAGVGEQGTGVDRLFGPVKRWLQDFF